MVAVCARLEHLRDIESSFQPVDVDIAGGASTRESTLDSEWAVDHRGARPAANIDLELVGHHPDPGSGLSTGQVLEPCRAHEQSIALHAIVGNRDRFEDARLLFY